MSSFEKDFANTSTNQLNERMRKALAEAKAAAKVADAAVATANMLLGEIKRRKVGVVEYIDPQQPELGTAPVMQYRYDGSAVLDFSPQHRGGVES